MDKLIIIKESDLKKLIKDAVTNAVDGVTKKIASKAALVYNNQIFGEGRRYRSVSHSSVGCGVDDDDDGGCGSSSHSYYTPPPCSCGRDDDGGCGSSSSRSSSFGGCGGGYESGGC